MGTLDILQEIFGQCHRRPWPVIGKFLRQLDKAKLDFDPIENLRVMAFQPQEGFPVKVPRWIFYFVPKTGYRPDAKFHLKHGTGIGVNQGCPIRLARALSVLFRLTRKERDAALGNLKGTKTHLSTVEELLWPIFWKRVRHLAHGINLSGNTDVDWLIATCTGAFYLETKHRISDWTRLADQMSCTLEDEVFLGKATDKFPRIARCAALNVVGLSGFRHLDPSDLSVCREELLSNRHINAVIFRPMLGPLFICSLDAKIAETLAALVRFPGPNELPAAYPVVHARQDSADRLNNSSSIPRAQSLGPRLNVIRVPDVPAVNLSKVPFPYRYRLREIKPSGEPIFEYVPPFLDADQSSDTASVSN